MNHQDILKVLLDTIDDHATRITDAHVSAGNPSWPKYKASVVQIMCDDIAGRAGLLVGFNGVVTSSDEE